MPRFVVRAGSPNRVNRDACNLACPKQRRQSARVDGEIRRCHQSISNGYPTTRDSLLYRPPCARRVRFTRCDADTLSTGQSVNLRKNCLDVARLSSHHSIPDDMSHGRRNRSPVLSPHRGSWAQYGIDLPGSLPTNKIPAILGRYPLLGFFCRLNIVPLDRDNGTSNSSNTDVVEKVNLLVAASQHGGTSVAEGSP